MRSSRKSELRQELSDLTHPLSTPLLSMCHHLGHSFTVLGTGASVPKIEYRPVCRVQVEGHLKR